MTRLLAPALLRRLVLATGLALFVVAVYGAVRGVCWAAGIRNPGLAVWLAVTAFVALLAPAARRRVERYADRLAYRPDGDPHAVMTRFVQRIADTLAVDDVLPDLARTASQAVHSPGSEVRLWLADGGEWRQTWPPGRDDVHATFSLALQRGGSPVGRLGVEVAEDQLGTADRELLDRLAGPAGLALANVRLTYELRERLRQATELAEQLRRSRRRLIGARAEQRHRFAAEVRDRVYGHLAAADAALAELPTGGERQPVLLERAGTAALAALEALRDLAAGVYPLALADSGLVDALEHHVDRLSAPVTLAVAGVDGTRVAPVVRAAAYFCCVGLVDDLLHDGPVMVGLDVHGDLLRLRVRSPGGPAAGRPAPDTVQIIRDRVDAFGGDLTVGCLADEVVVTTTLPLDVPADIVPAPTGAGNSPTVGGRR